MTPVFRELQADDFSQAARLHGTCFDEAWSADVLADLLTVFGTVGIVADCNRDMIGLAIVRCVGDQADLLTVCVDPENRGGGTGAALLSAVEAVSRTLGATELFLDVAETNSVALHLYQRAGYIITDVRKNYYISKNGRADALIMKKDLSFQEFGEDAG